MSKSYNDQERDIQKALNHHESDPSLKFTKLAELYDVPYHRLVARAKGRGTRANSGGHNKALSDDQETALCRIIDRLEDDGINCRVSMIGSIANFILRNAHDDPESLPPTVSSNWPTRFLDRREEYRIRISKPLAFDRSFAHDPEVIQEWYNGFRRTLAEFGVNWKDIWNFDETGFSIGIGGEQRIVTRKKNRSTRLYHPDPEVRQHISSCESIRTTGEILPPMIILEGSVFLEKWFIASVGLHPDTIVGLNDSGYMNDELSMHYIRHFDEYSRKNRVGAWRMLLSDGFGAHLHYDFVDYCWDNMIIPYSLPSHITHKMQPLDVACFQPLKHYHRQYIDKAVRLGATRFPVVEFFSAFEYIRNQAFKPSTIISAFKETGIHPWNPQKVLSTLQAKPQSHRAFLPTATPTTPPNPPSNPSSNLPTFEPRVEYFTPKKVSEIDALGTHIHGLMVQQGVDPALITAFEKMRKGALVGLHAGAQAEHQLHEMEVAKEARELEAKQGKKQVGHARGGPIYVKDARATKLSREQQEIEKDNRALVRMWEMEEAGNAGIETRTDRQVRAMNAYNGESNDDRVL